MSTNYPGGLDSFTTHHDNSNEVILAADVNKIQDAIAALETELGLTPKGSSSDVAARLATLVTTARQVISGTGLAGGGDLTVDRTLSVTYGTTSGTSAQGNDTRITGALQSGSNLSDVANAGTSRTNLGLGTAAIISSTAGGDLSGTLPSPTVAKVNGIAVSGTPSSGQVLAATSSSAAQWSNAAVVVDGGNATSTFAPVPVGPSYMSTAQIAADPAFTGTYVQIPNSVPAVTPEEFGAGATYNAAVDDTTFVQAAFDAATTSPLSRVVLRRLYNVPAGGLTISAASTEVVGIGGVFGGATASSTISGFTTASATADCLTVSANGVNLRNFAIRNTAATPTAGSGIKVSSNGYYWLGEGLVVSGFYDNIVIGSGKNYRLNHCHIFDPIRYGLYLYSSLGGVDVGDALITGCWFDMVATSRTPAAAVRWEGGGGSKLSGCKVNGGNGHGNYVNGFDFAIMDGGATSDIFVQGNSIENVTGSSVKLAQLGPSNTGTLENIFIQGNNMSYTNHPYGVDVSFITSTQLGRVVVTGNVISHATTNGVRINSALSPIVSDNVIIIATGASAAITLSQFSGGVVGVNSLGGVTPSGQWVATTGSVAAGLRMAQQAIQSGAGGVLHVDTHWNSGATNTAWGQTEYADSRALPSITSKVTYSKLYTFVMPSSGGTSLSLDFRINGVAVGVGPFSIVGSRVIEQTSVGSGWTVTTVGTDTATLPGNVDYQIDTVTTDRVSVSLKLNAGATATNVYGSCAVRVNGLLQYLVRV